MLTLQVTLAYGNDEYDIEKAFRRSCKDIVIPALCSIGLAGNALTFLVLVHRMNDGVETIERASLIGMISLAISDFAFCLVTLCQTFLDTNQLLYTSSWDMSLFVTMYGNFMQNIFIKTSTSVTVLMAVYRYVALTKPIKMCQNIGKIYKLKAGALMGVFIIWTVLYCPLLWMWKTQEISCPHGHVIILLLAGSFQNQNSVFQQGASTVWAILGFFLPVFILSYCNTCIIISLRRAKHGSNPSLGESVSCYKSCIMCFRADQRDKEDLLAQRRHKQRKQTSQWQTTVTLVAIILSFFLLTCPGELLVSCINLIPSWQKAHTLLTICHVLQALNMSLNFALYCIINSNFRRTTSKIFCDNIPQTISL